MPDEALGGGTRATDAPPPDGREVAAALGFVRGGGRTILHRQSVPYPFHITRPHAPDAAHPAFTTLILQSASGGLYSGDRLCLAIAASRGALAHVASQAATVVHAASGSGIAVETRLAAADGAYLAMSTDPYILFPGTTLAVQTEIALTPGATIVVAEGFATHDPAGARRPFTRLSARCRVRDDAGGVMVDEGSLIDGTSWQGAGSPLGRYRAMGTVMVLGAAAARMDRAGLERRLDLLGVLAGATVLPNGAGLGFRLLAHDGGPLARGLDAIVAAGFEAAFGRTMPVRRR